MATKQKNKRAFIGLFLSMVLIYIVVYVYSPYAAWTKTAIMKSIKRQLISKLYRGFTRGRNERQILASPSVLPTIPLKNTVEKFHLYSVVPVRSQKTFKGASLAIIGKTVMVGENRKWLVRTANDTFGKHFVKYNDNFVNQIFKIQKYTVLSIQKYIKARHPFQTTWYAEMPEEIAQKMFNPNSVQACTNVTVLLEEKETVVKAVANFQVCHNPSVLPQPENKVDTAYCINTPPFFSSKADYEEGKLSGGMPHVVPNILYHLHSGVDLFVIYIPASIRQIYLQLLEPVIQRYGHQLVFVDLSVSWGGIQVMPYINVNRENSLGIDVSTYALQKPLGQDCLNRLKGHARLFRTIDVDEYDLIFSRSEDNNMYIPKPFTFTQVNSTREKNVTLAWHDQTYKFPYITHSIFKLRSQTFDCLFLNNIWFIHEGMENEQILPNAKTYIPFAKGPRKSLCRPERIAVIGVHQPVNCFGQICKVKHINNATNDRNTNNGSKNKDNKQLLELGYAHIRHVLMAHDPSYVNRAKAEGNVIDTSIFNEVLKEMEDELVDLYGTNVPADLLKARK